MYHVSLSTDTTDTIHTLVRNEVSITLPTPTLEHRNTRSPYLT